MTAMSARGAAPESVDRQTPVTRYVPDERLGQITTRAGINVAFPAARPDARNQSVVRPSPDLLYTACVFDVSDSPLHITGPASDSYISLSGFAANTDNFFVINDRQLPVIEGRKQFDLLLVSGQAEASVTPLGANIVRAPTPTGILLFRTLITSEDDLDALYQLQAQQECNPL